MGYSDQVTLPPSTSPSSRSDLAGGGVGSTSKDTHPPLPTLPLPPQLGLVQSRERREGRVT